MNYQILKSQLKELGVNPKKNQVLNISAAIDYAFLSEKISSDQAFDLMQDAWYLWPDKEGN